MHLCSSHQTCARFSLSRQTLENCRGATFRNDSIVNHKRGPIKRLGCGAFGVSEVQRRNEAGSHSPPLLAGLCTLGLRGKRCLPHSAIISFFFLFFLYSSRPLLFKESSVPGPSCRPQQGERLLTLAFIETGRVCVCRGSDKQVPVLLQGSGWAGPSLSRG